MAGRASDARAGAELLSALAEVIEQRRQADPEQSYVAKLHARGLDEMLKKLGEESAETIIAGKNDDSDALVSEMADLWFHSLIVLAARGRHPDDVLDELARRFGLSGIAEKAARRASGQRSDKNDK
ncbi:MULTISPECIES: phosphoribosyl-ATP diphosphatase [unclassified Thioalkalivibrio]|uniref:phosphoribosyl-ATP diphosphatase n=1 Tax=unclassified Thioalkalivibrio TaxID=2621013 RepID=UPI000195A64C|nr:MULTISPECIES: phosphoribosyl-ATP diphosphatase [unclassified Thioalkalivibrio]ADC70645.1 phosphoribosyl-ATP diphosphatase [Thioalkalivibrio sp. K90mix]